MFFIFTGLSGKYLPLYTLHAYLKIVVKNAFKIAKHERANRKGNLRSFLKKFDHPLNIKNSARQQSQQKYNLNIYKISLRVH